MIFEEVKDIMVEQLGCHPDEVTMETKLKEDLMVDSLDIMELIVEFEHHFGIHIPDDDVKFESVQDIIDYLIDNR